MSQLSFHNKSFRLLQNSDTGQVTDETIFHYQQNDDLVTADYHGGTIRYGKIIAQLVDDKLHMMYQCLTSENELKAGKAIANISRSAEGKITLSLDWQWLESNGKGSSIYQEI